MPFFFLLLYSFALFASDQCEYSLLGQKNVPWQNWKNLYQEAETNQNALGGALAFTKMILAREKQDADFSKELGLNAHQLSALEKISSIFEESNLCLATNRCSYETPEKNSFQLGSKLKAATLQFTNTMPLYESKDLLKKKISWKQRFKKFAEKNIYDLAWYFGPYFYRVVPHFNTSLKTTVFANSIANKLFTSAVFNNLGLEQNIFSMEVAYQITHKPTIRNRVFLKNIGNISRIALATFLLNIWGYDPIKSARAEIMRPNTVRNYLESASQTGDLPETFKNKKVALLVQELDFNLPAKIFFRKDISQVNPAIKEIRQESSEFKLLPFYDAQSFLDQLKESKNSDFIFIISHGHPGKMRINEEVYLDDLMEGLSQNSLKPNATIVFISCMLGADDATWIQASQILLNGNGKAIASTQDLLLEQMHDITPNEINQRLKRERTSSNEEAFYTTSLRTLGGSQIEMLELIYLRLLQKYPPGFRVYDEKTGETVFHPFPKTE